MKMNKNTKSKDLIDKKNPEDIPKNNHPPKNKTVIKTDIKIIFAYSAKKNKANPIAEYSTLYPATNSASASGKSKGCLLVSARLIIKNIRNAGNKGITNQILDCAKIISRKLKLPAHATTVSTIIPKETS